MAAYANYKSPQLGVKHPNMFDKVISKRKELTKAERLEQGIEVWTAFYRHNIHRFVRDYFGIKLKTFQKIIIYMMAYSVNSIYLASRRQGKSYLIAIFSCAMCILYPGIKIIVAAGKKGQGLIIINKIGELKNDSTNLNREIKYYSSNISAPVVEFHNGSSIKAVASSDGSRGNYANIIVYDEYRMIKKSIIDTVLKKFRGSERMPKFYDKPEYKDYPKERNKQIFLSSAFYKFHWMWPHFLGYADTMLDSSKRYFACGLPYQLSMKEGLLSRDQVLEDMSESEFDEITWLMEMCAIFYGEGENAFFTYDTINDNRKIKIPIYPKPYYNLISDNKTIKYEPKQAGEIRFVVADIAAMGGNQNDNSAYIVFQLSSTNNNQYLRNVAYIETKNGGHTVDQAIRIRQLFDDFECDYIVLDTQGIGLGVFDNLVQELFDPEREIQYTALNCMNDDKMSERCKDPDAAKVIYSVKAGERFNSECAVSLRDVFKRGKMKILVNEADGRDLLNSVKAFGELNADEQALFELPFYQTTAMINEMVNLSYEINTSSDVKVKEPTNMRKDRYSALSYGNYFANTLENDLRVKRSNYEFMCLYN